MVKVGEMIRRWENPEKRARRLEVFGGGVRELKVISGEEAWREYGLSVSHLSKLPFIVRQVG